ncbi:MAG: UPF0149 family protein [Alphaproteobacteria bacterium]|jgi:uncharacterized protein|nr:UPF0149 family protein [Alphaproteobacteria bacterium]
MSNMLSKKLQRLDKFLLSDAVNDEAMMLSELDGFLAGLIVCPDMIMPSEWMPVIWGNEEPVFDNVEQAQTVSNLILEHYNKISRQLDKRRHSPVFDIDTRNDDVMWETWIYGFGQAMLLRPEAWRSWAEGDDIDLRNSLFVLGRLKQLATLAPQDIKPLDIDDELKKLAPDLIAEHVELLHHARLGMAKPTMSSANDNQSKVGRNDPCPCGSGKKFKKCCLN